MGQIHFYRLTQSAYDALETKDPDALYLTTDSRRFYAGDALFTHGISGTGHVTGGCCAKVTAYDKTNFILTLASADSEKELDMSRFAVGTDLTLNVENAADTANGGELLYQQRKITAVDTENKTVTLDADLLNVNVSSLDFDRTFCCVPDESRTDNPSAAGDKNFVTGERARAEGSWNTVTGMAAAAAGISNVVSGDGACAGGINNLASGKAAHAEGISSTASGLFAHAEGSSCKASGDSAHAEGTATEAAADSAYAGGYQTKATGRSSRACGSTTEANADDSEAHGLRTRTAAKHSAIYGMDGELSDSPENIGAFAIAGGTKEQPCVPFLFRTRKKVLNPAYDPEKDTSETGTDSAGEKKYVPSEAYEFRYRGRIAAETQELTEENITLDHDRFSRWRSTAATVAPVLANWLDGDCGELVFSGTLSLPQEWICCGDLNNTHPVNVLLIEQIGDTVFCKLKF